MSSFVLLGLLLASSSSLAQVNYIKNGDITTIRNKGTLTNNDLFFSKSNQLVHEAPDLKILQDGFVYGISTPRVLTSQTLGDLLGESSQTRKEVQDYVVQPGDSFQSIADNFKISLNTILWANNLSKGSNVKIGQTLIVLPVSGLLHVVRNGDTVSDIAKTYKAKVDDIVALNDLANEGDIFIGDILIILDGIMPPKVSRVEQTPLPDSFFIFPAEGQITQGLHYYNAVDLANKCGTPIYAAAAGTVQRAVSNGRWNFGMGNHITVLHSSGIVTYYGHLMTLFVSPGEHVNVGDRIGLMGSTGQSTGCHVHFDVIGAKNPLAKYFLGTILKYK